MTRTLPRTGCDRPGIVNRRKRHGVEAVREISSVPSVYSPDRPNGPAREAEQLTALTSPNDPHLILTTVIPSRAERA